MISVISVVNNDLIAADYLFRGLRQQNVKYELIIIDNKKSTFTSASKAYNSVTKKVNGDYLMFIHQDVFLPSCNWLREAENALSTVSRLGIAGVAGMLKPSYVNELELYARYNLMTKLGLYQLWLELYGRGTVFQGGPNRVWRGKSTSEISVVQTLDELLLIIPAKVFEQIRFDEKVCDNWHLYGVDYSLAAAKKGYEACVLPNPVFHLAISKMSKYYQTLTKLTMKHQDARVINTTLGVWFTRPGLLTLSLGLSKQTTRRKNKKDENFAIDQ